MRLPGTRYCQARWTQGGLPLSKTSPSILANNIPDGEHGGRAGGQAWLSFRMSSSMKINVYCPMSIVHRTMFINARFRKSYLELHQSGKSFVELSFCSQQGSAGVFRQLWIQWRGVGQWKQPWRTLWQPWCSLWRLRGTRPSWLSDSGDSFVP